LLPYQTCPFQYCYQLSLGAGFRPSLQPSWSPLVFPILFAVEELYDTGHQSGSFSLINVGSGFHCLRSFFYSSRIAIPVGAKELESIVHSFNSHVKDHTAAVHASWLKGEECDRKRRRKQYNERRAVLYHITKQTPYVARYAGKEFHAGEALLDGCTDTALISASAAAKWGINLYPPRRILTHQADTRSTP